MNKMVWRKKIAKLKRQLRNAVRGRMRQAVNFALANEPDIYESEEVEIMDEVTAENTNTVTYVNSKKKIFTKENIKKFAVVALIAIVAYKFGRRKSVNAFKISQLKKWNDFLNDLLMAGSAVIIDESHGLQKTYELTAKYIGG